MKKVTMIVLLAAVAMFWATSAFAVSGQCSDCHSMHDSQNGATMGAGNAILLTGDCVGCHTGTPAATGTPMVDTATAPATALAGGNFYWVGGSGDSYGHNVVGVDAADGTLSAAPGGTFNQQLTCAGTTGCHGDTTVAGDNAAVSGGHHGNVAIAASTDLNTATVGGSYRFLKGISGLEDSDYEFATAANNHNQYYETTAATGGISDLCASCHTNFHGTANTQSGGAWIRHPTEVDLAAAGLTTNAGTYSATTPVATTDLTGGVISDASVAGDGMVTCLSCHRAHGSDQPDLLRFNYSLMQAGAGGGASDTGCFYCHAAKD